MIKNTSITQPPDANVPAFCFLVEQSVTYCSVTITVKYLLGDVLLLAVAPLPLKIRKRIYKKTLHTMFFLMMCSRLLDSN